MCESSIYFFDALFKPNNLRLLQFKTLHTKTNQHFIITLKAYNHDLSFWPIVLVYVETEAPRDRQNIKVPLKTLFRRLSSTPLICPKIFQSAQKIVPDSV